MGFDIKQAPLFRGIVEEDLEKLLEYLAPEAWRYSKNEIVYSTGEETQNLGMVLAGGVRIIVEDFIGNTNIMCELSEWGIFGDELFDQESRKSEVTIRAHVESELMFIDREKIVTPCLSAGTAQARMLSNMFGLISKNKAALNERLYILGQRTTKDKLLAYFYIQAKRAGSGKFNIPFNRAELAAYLCVDRSAMSRELCAMRDSGILEFYKSAFILAET